MKTTFSHFPGMFENPAPAKIIKKKKNQIRKFILLDQSFYFWVFFRKLFFLWLSYIDSYHPGLIRYGEGGFVCGKDSIPLFKCEKSL